MLCILKSCLGFLILCEDVLISLCLSLFNYSKIEVHTESILYNITIYTIKHGPFFHVYVGVCVRLYYQCHYTFI